jgi:hypothetical protein
VKSSYFSFLFGQAHNALRYVLGFYISNIVNKPFWKGAVTLFQNSEMGSSPFLVGLSVEVLILLSES